jgi:hypothetical protein
MAVASAVACLLALDELIKVLIVVQALFQFAAQCVAVELLRRKRGRSAESYRMPLYPFPAVIALAGWIYIALSSGLRYVVIALSTVVAGAGVYLIKARFQQEWPFSMS